MAGQWSSRGEVASEVTLAATAFAFCFGWVRMGREARDVSERAREARSRGEERRGG